MSALIKSIDAERRVTLRAIPGPPPAPVAEPAPPPVPLPDPELLALKAELGRAAARIAALEAGAARLEKKAAEAAASGEAAGRRAAAREAEALHAETLKLLGRGIETGLERFADALTSLDRLAVLVARESMARLVADPDERLELLAGTIRHRLDMLKGQAALRILVSSRDFEDAQQVAVLAAATGRAVEVEASDELRPGDCSIVLRLGTLEVGIGQQWSRIDALLGVMADPA